MPTVRTYIEVDLDDFDDHDIVDEVFRRKLERRVLDRIDTNIKTADDVRKAASTIMSDIMSRRPMQARNDFIALMRATNGGTLVDAFIAFIEGREADTLCLLDRVVEPSPAAGKFQPQEPEPLLP